WDREQSFPSQYPDVDDWINYVEQGTNRSGDPDGRIGKCNTNTSMNDQLTPAARDFLFNFNIHSDALETGSFVTDKCQSRYGIQDMVGNVWEKVSDELACADTLGNSCVGQV